MNVSAAQQATCPGIVGTLNAELTSPSATTVSTRRSVCAVPVVAATVSSITKDRALFMCVQSRSLTPGSPKVVC